MTADGHPWAEWGEWAAGDEAAGQRVPGRHEPLEPRQGPPLGAAPARARRRGRLRPPPGRSLPPRDDVPALAARTGQPRCRYDQLAETPAYELAAPDLRRLDAADPSGVQRRRSRDPMPTLEQPPTAEQSSRLSRAACQHGPPQRVAWAARRHGDAAARSRDRRWRCPLLAGSLVVAEGRSPGRPRRRRGEGRRRLGRARSPDHRRR